VRRTAPKGDSIARFWTKARVVPCGGCWEWTGVVSGNGYGRFDVYAGPKPRDWRTLYAHRFAYELLVGPIPPGLHIDHLCRNRLCVNPTHLEPVTQAENNRRGRSPIAANLAKTHCLRGHELRGDNVRLTPGGRGRVCRTCHREKESARYHAGKTRRNR
jgi:hypothetical protein